MNTPSLRSIASFVSALWITSLACVAQTPAESSISFRQIGKVTPRSAKEIASSDWSIGCETLDRDLADYSKYKQYLGPLGAKAVRLQGGWAKTEKKPGVYDWKWLDEIIDDAISKGVRPWVELSYGNPAYPGGGGATLGDGMPSSEEAIKGWDAWAKAMVHRYKDRVSEWEVWNEPDLTKQVTPEIYAAMYIRTAEMIRVEQPGAKIYALGLARNGQHAAYARSFLRQLAAEGKLGLVDAITFHGYPQNPDDLSSYTKVKAFVEKFPAKIELRQGESGAPSVSSPTGALSGFEWTELSQAKWNLRRMMAHHNVGVPMNLFTLSDFIYNDARRKGLNAKGLVSIREDKSVVGPKAAYAAAQHVFSIFDASVVLDKECVATSNAEKPLALQGYRKQPSGGSIVVAWFNGEPAAETNAFTPVDFTFKGVSFQHPVYVDLRTGAVYEIPAGTWSAEGEAVRFRSIPVYDSPILIAEKTAFLFK